MGRMVILAYWRESYKEPFNPKFYLTVSVSVPKPTFEYPVACVIASLRSSHSRVLYQCRSLAEARQIFTVPEEVVPRLEAALREAQRQADFIEQRFRDLHRAANPSEPIMGGETKPIVAEVEDILKKGRRKKS